MSTISASTIFIKPPINYRQSLINIKEKCKDYSILFSLFFWIIAGLYSASKSSFNPNITGLQVTFPVSDLILITISSILLYFGIIKRQISLTVPWIILSVCSIYYNHYNGLMNVLSTLKTVKKISWLPWGTLFSSIILLVIRGTLTIRIFQLCTHIWFKEKLKKIKSELKKK